MATTLVDWLNDGTIPQNKTSGNWTPSAFNTGKFRFTLTFAAASTGSPWRPASLTYWAVLTTNEANGSAVWLEYNPSGTTHRLLFVGSDGATNLAAMTFTWGASSAVTITIDQSSATAGASTMTLSGASTGNGTSSGWTRASVFSGANLYFGVWGSGGFGLPAGSVTTSDIDDGNDGISGTGTPTIPAVTSTGAGALPLAATGTPSVPAVTSTGAGALPLAGSGSATVGTPTSAGAGALALAGAGSPVIGAVTSEGSGGGPGGIAGTGTPTVDSVSSAGSGAVIVAGSGTAAVGAVGNSGSGALSLAASGGPTVPAVSSTADGDLAIAGTGSPDIGAITLTSANSEVPSLGSYDAQRVLYGTAAGTVTTESLTTTDGSTFVIVTGGNLGDLADPPTDSKSNTYTQLGAAEEFQRWADYGLALWICVDGVGGSGHTFSQEYGQTLGFDEMTVAAMEVRNGHHVQGYTIAQALTGNALNFTAISTTAPAILAAFFCGDAPTGATTTVSLSNGYSIIDTDTLPDHPNGYVPIAIGYADKSAPGSYGTTATETPDQGAIMIQAALQAAETRAGTGSPTVGAVISTGSGALTSAGQLASTIAPITSVGAGALSIAASGTPSVPPVPSAGSGALPVAGSGTPSVPAVSVTGAGALPISGAGSAAVAAVAVEASATLPIAGTATASVDSVVAEGAGALPLAGAGAPVVGAVTSSGSGAQPGTGQLSQSIAPVTASGSGALSLVGTSEAAVGAVSSSAAAAISIAGTGTASVGSVTSATGASTPASLPARVPFARTTRSIGLRRTTA